MTTQDKPRIERSRRITELGYHVISRAPSLKVTSSLATPTVMGDVFYFGASPHEDLSELFANAGCGLIHSKFKKGILYTETKCVAVVLHWKSKIDQQVIEEAKAIGLPVLVITSKLNTAVQAGEPSADVYLEAPAKNEEVSTMLMEMIVAKRETRKSLTFKAGQ